MEKNEPILLLKGTRWGIQDTFDTFDTKLTLLQHPQFISLDYSSHEAKTGLTIWDASIALSKYFETFSKGYFKGKSILELGSGCGLLGLSLATQGANVILSDLDSIVPLLDKNIELNKLNENAKAIGISWGKKNNDGILNVSGKFDFIIASDCLWVDYLIEPFTETIDSLSSKETTIFISHEIRSKYTQDHFFQLMESKNYQISSIKFEEMNKNFRDENINIWKLKKK